MKKPKLTLSIIGLLTCSLLIGQTPAKLASINKKVVGKWVTVDKKSYIEFLPDGSCSNENLWDDGKWHIESNKLGAWQDGDNFSCGGGALTLTGANTLIRDYGMGGKPDVY